MNKFFLIFLFAFAGCSAPHPQALTTPGPCPHQTRCIVPIGPAEEPTAAAVLQEELKTIVQEYKSTQNQNTYLSKSVGVLAMHLCQSEKANIFVTNNDSLNVLCERRFYTLKFNEKGKAQLHLAQFK